MVRPGLFICATLSAFVACGGGKPDAEADTRPCSGSQTPRPGLEIERVPGPTGCVTVVHIDPAHFRLRLLTALADGGPRTAPEWAKEFGLVGLINASMYAPDQRSIGMLVSSGSVIRGKDNERLGAFFAFDPIEERDAAVLLTGRDCDGFDLGALRRRYRSIVQNFRLLDCDGRPVTWKDARRFSAAAVGIDDKGRPVFIHARAPMQMSDFAELLASRHLRAAMYVEGGPEASLYVRAGDLEVTEMGTALFGNRAFFSIPNVLGFVPREE